MKNDPHCCRSFKNWLLYLGDSFAPSINTMVLSTFDSQTPLLILYIFLNNSVFQDFQLSFTQRHHRGVVVE